MKYRKYRLYSYMSNVLYYIYKLIIYNDHRRAPLKIKIIVNKSFT